MLRQTSFFESFESFEFCETAQALSSQHLHSLQCIVWQPCWQHTEEHFKRLGFDQAVDDSTELFFYYHSLLITARVLEEGVCLLYIGCPKARKKNRAVFLEITFAQVILW